MVDMKWPCRLRGRIDTIDGRVRVVDRRFEGAGDVVAAARLELKRRKDGGSPWFGDSVVVTTPLGQRIVVDIPWPGEDR